MFILKRKKIIFANVQNIRVCIYIYRYQIGFCNFVNKFIRHEIIIS